MSTVPAASPRRARSFRTVALGGAVLSVLMVALTATLYVRLLRYERVAARHVPPGSALAVRLDVEQALVYEPVRRHLLPLLGGPSRGPDDADAHLRALESSSGLARSQLRELVLARGTVPGDWVVILGGLFPGPTTADALAGALAAEPGGWQRSGDGRVVAQRETGIAVARGTDGVVLVGSSDPFVRLAAEPNPTYQLIGLPPRGAGAIAISRDGIRELSLSPWVLASGELSGPLQGLTALTASLDLSDRYTVELAFEDDGGGHAKRFADALLALARGLPGKEDSRAGGLVRLAADRAVRADPSPTRSTLALAWEREEADEALALIAATVRSRFR